MAELPVDEEDKITCCDVCGVSLPAEASDGHLDSSFHRYMLHLREIHRVQFSGAPPAAVEYGAVLPTRISQPYPEVTPAVGAPPSGAEANRLPAVSLSILARFHCELCQKSCSGPTPWEAHATSARHLKKVAEAQRSSSEQPEPFECTLCGTTMTCRESYDMHMSGRKHRVQAEKTRFSLSVPAESAEGIKLRSLRLKTFKPLDDQLVLPEPARLVLAPHQFGSGPRDPRL